MPWPDPITLRGQHARLEPLSKEHREGLVEAVKDGNLSTIWYTAIPTPDNVAKEIDRRLALQVAGSMLPFLLKRLGFDPASASAPFVATLVDVTGLVIYFSVAYLMLRGTLL